MDNWSAMAAYITKVRSFLRMDNWDIWLMTEQLTNDDMEDWDDLCAHVEWNNNHDSAQVWIREEWWAEAEVDAPHTITDTIIHELLHLQHRDLTIHWLNCTKYNDVVSNAEFPGWDGDMQRHLERIVSNWARSLVPYAPPWLGASKYEEWQIGRGIEINRRGRHS